MQLLKLIKNNLGLFDRQKDVSDWDYLLKFWGNTLERLSKKKRLEIEVVSRRYKTTFAFPFTCTFTLILLGETLIWRRLKVDLRVLKDEIVLRYNKEAEVAEFAKSSPGFFVKFSSDRCKLQIEAKLIIDNRVSNDIDITSVDSLKICGLEIFINSLSVEAPGLYYVNNEIFHSQLDVWN